MLRVVVPRIIKEEIEGLAHIGHKCRPFQALWLLSRKGKLEFLKIEVHDMCMASDID